MKKVRGIWQSIKRWYIGIPYENDPGSPVVFLNHMARPTMAIRIDETLTWCKKHGQFLISTGIGVTGLIIGIIGLLLIK